MLHGDRESMQHRGPSLRTFGRLLAVAVFVAALTGCPAPVREPSPRAPVPPKQAPAPTAPRTLPPAAIKEYPTQVALLLPLTGRQQAAAIAVRDGFFASYFQQDPARRPQVRVYDIGEDED